jgi:hypothetical protein
LVEFVGDLVKFKVMTNYWNIFLLLDPTLILLSSYVSTLSLHSMCTLPASPPPPSCVFSRTTLISWNILCFFMLKPHSTFSWFYRLSIWTSHDIWIHVLAIVYQ